MNYPQTLAYLYERLPMFQRIGAAAYKANLDNTLAICKLLGNPENKFKSIHIAGTNGKGSTSHMLAAILQEAGYKTGLYTSPHLKDFRERIRINGKKIPKSEVLSFVKEYKKEFEKIEPSFFEWSVGLAFHFFAKQKVDIAVIETGMGGRLDSTNVINPLVSVITNISLDHTLFLGDTIPKIAFEKAGIIKANTPVIIGETHPESSTVFKEVADNRNAKLFFADKIWKVDAHKMSTNTQNILLKSAEKEINLNLDLRGKYQLKNIKPVIQTVELLNNAGFEIQPTHQKSALKKVKKLTGLLGRWQTLQKKPLCICDTGHNEAGITEVVQNILDTPHAKLHLVVGMVSDKDVSTVLKLFPKKASYYFCKPAIARGLDADILKNKATEIGLIGSSYQSVADALQAAKETAQTDDLIVITGSTFVVAEVV